MSSIEILKNVDEYNTSHVSILQVQVAAWPQYKYFGVWKNLPLF